VADKLRLPSAPAGVFAPKLSFGFEDEDRRAEKIAAAKATTTTR
jgi:hypothetical protein